MNEEEQDPLPHKKYLSETQKWTIVAKCSRYYDWDQQKFIYGKKKDIANEFGISPDQLKRIFDEYLAEINNEKRFPDLAPIRGIPRGPHSDLDEELAECICEFNSLEGYYLPIREFTIKFNKIYGTGYHHTTMQKYMKHLNVVSGTSYVKPTLSLFHRWKRLNFILSPDRIMPLDDNQGNYRFKDIKNTVHIDEKWFYVTRGHRRIRKIPGEELHNDETTHHKSHIEKVMFLAVVGVPQEIPTEFGGGYFDGKIGIFPVIDYETAQRNSVNRPAGT